MFNKDYVQNRTINAKNLWICEVILNVDIQRKDKDNYHFFAIVLFLHFLMFFLGLGKLTFFKIKLS